MREKQRELEQRLERTGLRENQAKKRWGFFGETMQIKKFVGKKMRKMWDFVGFVSRDSDVVGERFR